MTAHNVATRDRDQGFVLVLTLLMLAVITTGVVALMTLAKSAAVDVAGLEDAARARAVAQAASVRAAYSVMVQDDLLKVFSATEAAPARWRFDGLDVDISTQRESDKVDINKGNGELVAAVLAASDLTDPVRSGVQDANRAARAEGRMIPSLSALLDPCERLGASARELGRRMTVMTGARGLSPRRGAGKVLALIPSITPADIDRIGLLLERGRSPLDDRSLAHLFPYLSDGTSLSKIDVEVRRGERVLAEREVVISFLIRRPFIEVVSVQWKLAVAPSFCG